MRPGAPRAVCRAQRGSSNVVVVPVSSPHDALFKAAFSDTEQAAPLLRSQLDPRIADAIDWSTLERVSGSFIDETLRSRFTDLLFVCRIGGREALVYLLVEHQSRSDHWMALRMLRYVLRIWERYRRDHPEAVLLPPVLGVVLHHSTGRWSAPEEVLDLVDLDDALRPVVSDHVPKMRFVLDDLDAATDALLASRALLAFGELTLRALRDLRHSPRPIEVVRRWIPLMRRVLTAPSGLQSIRAILEYVYEVASVEQDDLVAVVEALGPGSEEIDVTTLGERLRAEGRVEGRAEGRVEGRAEGRAELLLHLVALRFGTPSEATSQRVLTADAATLDRFAARLLTAESLEGVFADAP